MCVWDVFRGTLHDLRWTDSWSKNDLLLDGLVVFLATVPIKKNGHGPVFHSLKKNICYNTEISRSYFSGLPPNISILHIFVGKIPCHCETQPPTALQQNVVQVTSSEFAHQCHSTNSHSQDVNGTSRKCSPLYLEKKKCEQCPKKITL